MADVRTMPINIALQGGGAHGAFTWGVLDRLLEEGRIYIRAVSGTSAGAMNATALVQGLASGGRPAAQALLGDFWAKVSAAARFSPVQRTLFDVMMGRWSLDLSPGFVLSQHLQRAFAPEELNPLGINPLRDIGWRSAERWLEEHFEELGVRTTWRPSFVTSESLWPAHLPEGVERKLEVEEAKDRRRSQGRKRKRAAADGQRKRSTEGDERRPAK